METIGNLICFCCRSNRVTPVLTCGMCFEVGARKRICCNAVYCDLCYTKNKLCPNCGTLTKKEDMTGATYVLPLFSEHEECRVCLDPGLRRHCCGNYYCDDCYYALTKCRSCDALVGEKNSTSKWARAATVSVLIGWLVTIFLTLSVLAATAVISSNYAQTPTTVSNYHCWGFFKKCDLDVCIDLQPAVAEGNTSLPPLSTWRTCTSDSLVKLRSKACVFDDQLFSDTETVMGYDVCSADYTPGVYIFEDTFEMWSGDFASNTFENNTMKSALWHKIVNGHSAPYCGAAEGSRALVFTGEQVRYAETRDVDVSNGGWLELQLFISPLGFDVTTKYCKTNYAGTIEILYSLDQGKNWTMLQRYAPERYRNNKFFPVKFEFPEDSHSAQTRFRFQQTTFSAARDAWALDNVRVFRRLPKTWNTDNSFMTNVHKAKQVMQQAQCCFDTDWCQTRMTEKQMSHCKDFIWYNGRRYLLRSAELYIFIVALLNICKFIYISFKDALIRRRFPFQDLFDDVTQIDWIMKHVPARYRPKRVASDQVSNIHNLARLGQEAKKLLNDADGEGDRVKTDQELQEEKEARRRDRVKRQMKLLARRNRLMKLQKNKFAKKEVEELNNQVQIIEDESAGDVEAAEEKDPTKFGTGILANNKDRMKRQNLVHLRVPYDISVSLSWRTGFTTVTLGIYVIMVLYLISTTTYYVVHQQVRPYGVFKGEIAMTSLTINFLAVVCDFKEIYYTLRYVIMATDRWVPPITIDRTDDTSALFIGPYTIPFVEIKSANVFSKTFAMLCAAGYFLGCFPWCLLAIILRNQYLRFSNMRIVSPLLAGMCIARSILGSGFFVKIAFSSYFVCSLDINIRDRIGTACQGERTKLDALFTALGFSLLAVFLCAAVAVEWTGPVFGIALVVGYMYGAYTGFSHALPVRPWMMLTDIREGTYLVVKKNQPCPCKYWGKFCTTMHEVYEVMIIFTTEDMKFISMVKYESGTST